MICPECDRDDCLGGLDCLAGAVIDYRKKQPMNMVEMFVKFYEDEEGDEMFVEGRAGTGKTTELGDVIIECEKRDINVIVCAFTHKACGVLRSKLPSYALIQTLHSFLKKAPTVNDQAVRREDVTVSRKFGDAEKPTLVVIDEFSQVGEKDLMDLRDLECKLLWIGDPYQLPPVRDAQAVTPWGDYHLKLTKIWRQAEGNPLIGTLTELVDMIEADDAWPLVEHEKLHRGKDIIRVYQEHDHTDKVVLCYTNKQVEWYNKTLQGRDTPQEGDLLFSPTLKQYVSYLGADPWASKILTPRGPLTLDDDKYGTINFLTRDLGMEIHQFESLEDNTQFSALMSFGHGTFKDIVEEAKNYAAEANKAIKAKGIPINDYVQQNPGTKLVNERRKAWRRFLAINHALVCFDFAHAMTVHKSQGSTFNTVFIDMEDLDLVRTFDQNMYLRLTYVAMSRASNLVITN